MKKRMITVLFLLAIAADTTAQTGAITGTVTDHQEEPVIGAVVQAQQGLIVRTGATTDENGAYTIRPIAPGRYDLKVSYVGMNTSVTTGVIVSPGRLANVDVKFSLATVHDSVEFKAYRTPAIEVAMPTTSVAEEIEKMPVRSEAPNIHGCSGSGPWDSGGGFSIQGARTEGTLYYIDGVQVRGGASKPAKKSFWQRLKFWN